MTYDSPIFGVLFPFPPGEDFHLRGTGQIGGGRNRVHGGGGAGGAGGGWVQDAPAPASAPGRGGRVSAPTPRSPQRRDGSTGAASSTRRCSRGAGRTAISGSPDLVDYTDEE